ncbi:MAG: hypothetical protein A2W25_12225 [candidate division Zixibacteria bacterium RBG_16_53_22]|nr:MAG: hypothetical protein A2W25_12225 [candidate division Zixibacteria bacterium RBG_16_53_22]
MKTQTYHLKITLLEPMLGTAPANKDIYTSYFKQKSLDAAAKAGVELAPETIDKQAEDMPDEGESKTTGFHRLPDGRPYIMSYMIGGFMKEAASTLRKVDDSLIASNSVLRAFRKFVDSQVFFRPHRVPLEVAGQIEWAYVDEMSFSGGGVSDFQRSLRASTPMGERVALAKSEVVPPGTSLECTMEVLGDDVDEETLREWFDYGRRKGLGQFRSSKIYGTFEYELRRLS